MLNQNDDKYNATEMYSNFPPSLPPCWEKDYVVRLKRTRKKQLFSSSIRGSRHNMRDENTNNPSDDNEYKEVNLGKRKSFFFCGHLDATINKMSMYNIISFVLIFFIFNIQITSQRPVHNHVEEGSLTSAMVRYTIYSYHSINILLNRVISIFHLTILIIHHDMNDMNHTFICLNSTISHHMIDTFSP